MSDKMVMLQGCGLRAIAAVVTKAQPCGLAHALISTNASHQLLFTFGHVSGAAGCPEPYARAAWKCSPGAQMLAVVGDRGLPDGQLWVVHACAPNRTCAARINSHDCSVVPGSEAPLGEAPFDGSRAAAAFSVDALDGTGSAAVSSLAAASTGPVVTRSSLKAGARSSEWPVSPRRS